jgi:uncharacterized repeat protein (TIGR01451 family)
LKAGPLALALAAAVHGGVPETREVVPRRIHPAPAPAASPARSEVEEPPAGLTRDDWTQIRSAIQESQYHASTVAAPGEVPSLQARNRRQAYRTTFGRDGIEIVSQNRAGASWWLGVSVTGYGYADDVRPLRHAEPQAHQEKVEYRRGLLTEWYVNRPGGLEQGFELEAPPHPTAAPLIVAMAVQGDLDASVTGNEVSFARDSGETLVRYAGLKAWDADGHPLPSRLEAADRTLRIVVEAQEARFPVTVDPMFVHEAQLFGQGDPIGEAGFPGFGGAVSVSGDTAVVGAPGDDTGGLNRGVAYVFVRSGTTWTEQQKLLASDGEVNGSFGISVSISGDTAVVGKGHPLFVESGAAYVFVRSGTTWTQQQKLVAGASDFGISVSISGDTAVVGAIQNAIPPSPPGTGVAYVFVRSGTTWTQQQMLLASDGASGDFFGLSVSVSGDTAVVGADLDDNPGGTDAGSAYVFVRSGTTWTEQQKLLASDGAAGDSFGNSVSFSGDTAVVGAYLDDTLGGMDAGSAYVFVRSGTTWTEQQKLLASDGAADDYFGRSVSVSGDTAVVGAYQYAYPDPTGAGAAYVFVRAGTTWSEQQKLLASDGAAGDFFGNSVSVSGDTAVVGAPGHDAPGGTDSGSAYVFVRSGTTWTEQQKLLGSDDFTDDAFGWSVSVSGDTAVVGAYLDDTLGGTDAGSAYVFVRSGTTWTEQQKLLAPDGAAGDNFGRSVSVAGDTAVVGAAGDDTPGGANAGSAYVFVRSGTTWTEQQKLLASDGLMDDGFGESVAISGDTAVVGAEADDTGAANKGSAYVFVRSGTTWTEQQKLLASDGAGFDFFGHSVSLSGDTAVVGAYADDILAATDAGSAYVFVRSGTTWTQQQKLIAPDAASDDQFGGSVSISADTAVVGAEFDDTPGTDAGSVYIFVRSGTTWTLQKHLFGGALDRFGGSVSISGDTAVVGAESDDTPGGVDAGSAYVFVRSGTTWTQQQQLLAPDGAAGDFFGVSVSVSGDTAVVGAYLDDVPGAWDAGSAHVFRVSADLGVTKTDGQTTAVPGQTVTYTIVAGNAGPSDAPGATVTDAFPAALTGVTWTCVPAGGATCTPSGSGDINDTVNLPAGGTATYTAMGTIDAGATGTLSNTATVAPAGGIGDPNPGNNSATDTDTLTPPTDLGITKADSADPVSPGDPLTYTLTITNAGPWDSASVTATDVLPPGVTFVSSNPPAPICNLAGATLTCGLGPLAAGANATVTIDVTVNPSGGGVLVNTATVSGSTTDPNPADNTASASTVVKGAKAELAHGTNAVFDLAAVGGMAAEHVFLISQKPLSSYEVVIDATSGDIGAGAGPLLQRIGSDGTTVLQDSTPVGPGPSRSLRWRNATSATIEDQTVRVRSASCGTDCGPDDVYRIRAYETTGSVPRFNNSGTQVTVLVLQNPTNDTVAGEIYFTAPSGTQVGVHPFSLAPKATLVLNTTTVPGVAGASGAITVAHDGRYGDLSGKTVALEPATGFSFDSALEPRPRPH